MIDFSTPLAGMARAESNVNQIATRLAQPADDSNRIGAASGDPGTNPWPDASRFAARPAKGYRWF